MTLEQAARQVLTAMDSFQIGAVGDPPMVCEAVAVLREALASTPPAKAQGEPLLSAMDIAVLGMPLKLAMGGDVAQFQYHERVQSLLDRIEALPAQAEQAGQAVALTREAALNVLAALQDAQGMWVKSGDTGRRLRAIDDVAVALAAHPAPLPNVQAGTKGEAS